jgi:acetylornithine aminotransferase/acetylornithine/N-succinyldiaminopimelate aminotransferase
MNLKQIQELESQYLIANYKKYPFFVDKGRRCLLYDYSGKRYVDLLAGIAVNALGYNHPRINNVIRKQIKKTVHISNLFYHPYQANLARKLVEISGLEKVFFCNSGTEAVEAAFKLARGYAYKNNLGDSKYEILTLDNAFHGRTYGALSATASDKYRKPYAPLVPGFRFVRFNDVDDLKAQFNEKVCALILEPIQGEGGIHTCTQEFLKVARELCSQQQALLIFDEIQCGIGRTGRYFYFQGSGILPDILTLAKPLGLGLPLGAVLTNNRIAQTFGPGDHGTTFGGGPLACRVGFEFIKILQDENLLEHIQQVGEFFKQKLIELKEKHSCIREVRGEGLILGAELTFPCREIVNQCLKAGFIINVTSERVLRFLPPYIITKKEISRFIKALDQILAVFNPPETERPSQVQSTGGKS